MNNALNAGTSPQPEAPHSELPLRLAPCQVDHGESTVIVDKHGLTVAVINSAVWDESAELEYPQDRANAALILRAVNTFHPAVDALTVMRDLALLQQRAAAETDADLLWQYREEIGAAIEQANLVLTAMGVSEPSAPMQHMPA
jgi:hypothetical protein